jgi:NADH-quinone oxidoreductase subunit H
MTIEETLYPVLWFLLFPGLVFTGLVGLLITWIDRKVTARVQYRVGPPWWQPFADVVKLLGKETIVPAGASRLAFFGAPLVAIAGAALVSTMIWVSLIWDKGFAGDIFVVLYLLVLPSLALVIGGAASRNPLAAVGASREMKLILSYELPFVLGIVVVLVKSGGRLGLAEIFSAEGQPFLGSVSGVLTLLVMFLVTQAKLGLVPFDQAEAETEIMGGALIEYSGAPLAAFKLAKAMLYFTLPVLATFLLMGGMGGATGGAFVLKVVWRVLVGLLVVVLVVLTRNTNPRVRIEHAVRFFWGPVTALAGIGVVLALLGARYGLTWL